MQQAETKKTAHCGKSTVDGSYVKGVLKKDRGTSYINEVPVHPWSVGVIIGKITPFKLK